MGRRAEWAAVAWAKWLRRQHVRWCTLEPIAAAVRPLRSALLTLSIAFDPLPSSPSPVGNPLRVRLLLTSFEGPCRQSIFVIACGRLSL